MSEIYDFREFVVGNRAPVPSYCVRLNMCIVHVCVRSHHSFRISVLDLEVEHGSKNAEHTVNTVTVNHGPNHLEVLLRESILVQYPQTRL